MELAMIHICLLFIRMEIGEAEFLSDVSAIFYLFKAYGGPTKAHTSSGLSGEQTEQLGGDSQTAY